MRIFSYILIKLNDFKVISYINSSSSCLYEDAKLKERKDRVFSLRMRLVNAVKSVMVRLFHFYI